MPDFGSTCWRISFPEQEIALLHLDTPGRSVNLLDAETFFQLDRILDQLDASSEVVGLIVASGKPGKFLAGADIHALRRSIDESRDAVRDRMTGCQATLRRLSSSRYVTVAAVDGVCLGGGAELACWCDRRVLSTRSATQFGFPEIQLGLIPGWGGTARLPRLVGLDHAVPMVALDHRIGAEQAGTLGLADEVVPARQLIDAAVAVIRHELGCGRLPAERQRLSGPMAVSAEEVALLSDSAARSIAEKWHDRRPAASVALRLLLENTGASAAEACQSAAEAFVELLGSPVNVALLNVYLLREHNKQDAVVPGDVAARRSERVGIVGAGIMGIGVAAAHLKHQVPVRLADASDEALSRAMKDVLEEVASAPPGTGFEVVRRPIRENSEAFRERERPTPPPNSREFGYSPSKCATSKTDDDAPDAMDAVRLLDRAASLDDLADCDFVVETVVETAEVKRRIYEQLEPHLAPQAVLVSNTSTILISSLARSVKHPERFCGMHYFNPVRHMRLVEVIRGDLTSDTTVATVVDHAKRIGKMPIVVHDSPGFLVNRLLSPYLNESLELLIAGAAITDIDRVAEQFGMPLGPLALYDLVGVDTSFYAGRTLWEAFPDRIAALPVLPALFRKGRLGRKSGFGFYRYDPGSKRGEPDPRVPELLEPYVRRTREISEKEITERLFLPMLLEATRLLESGVVRDVRDIDLGMIYGLGFPAERGGLLFWADTLDAARIVAMLEPYARLGSRLQPTAWLLDMAAHGRKFYDSVPAEVRIHPKESV
jgi:3-hydroxyacyl-CoA dehydrogenase/enoyl-CoA hydratase/carnithine racemase